MLVAEESFLGSLIKLYGKHIVYSDGGSWYPEACNSLRLKHILHTPFEASGIFITNNFTSVWIFLGMMDVLCNF